MAKKEIKPKDAAETPASAAPRTKKAEGETPKTESAKPAAKAEVKSARPAREATTQRKPAVVSEGAPLAHGVGRRKTAVARVWLRRGKGGLVVNEKDYVSYFDTETARKSASLPFAVYKDTSKYDVQANVLGGGMSAQADAVKLGIARALLEINPDLRPLLRQFGLLTVDPRVKERKKYGQKAARRKFQFVKR